MEIDVRSKELLNSLTAGLDFSVPNVDQDGASLKIPEALSNALQGVPDKLTVDLLTERVVDGNGCFDSIMTALKAHLTVEYEAGRITGAEYTKAYIASLQGALQFAVQYLLGKDLSYYQALGAQAQALQGNIGAYTAKVQLAIAQAQAHTTKAQYASEVLKLGSMEEQTKQVVAQTGLVGEQTKHTTAQTDLVGEQTKTQTEQTKLVTANAGLVGEQTKHAVAQTGLVTEQTNTQEKQTANVAAQTLLVGAQTEVQKQQKDLLKEQTEQAHAQVSDTRLDGTTPVAGYTGNQNALLKQQVVSFKKDAIIKSAKIYADSFATQLSMSTATSAGTGLDANGIGKAIGKLAASMES